MDLVNYTDRFELLARKLTSELNDEGFWSGELSSSALATAVSIVALKLGDPQQLQPGIVRGLSWLTDTINADGGFGDSPDSLSNVSTTLLCYAAFRFCAREFADLYDKRRHSVAAGSDVVCMTDFSNIICGMEQYLVREGVEIQSDAMVASILGYYGKDYTFSVPILSMLVICKVLDAKALELIPRLPYELALLPFSLYRFFNLQVVSYAIPALVAVGIYLFKHKSRPDPLTSFTREKAIKPALSKLGRMMPESGGFLEAVPLTAFVSMCLIKSGFSDNQVVIRGIMFIKKLQRPDGSWPIDTDLSTWVTTLGIKAMGRHLSEFLPIDQRVRLRSHLLNLQYQLPHQFNNASPGGWGWSSFSGSVPDADDTAGAILALLELEQEDPAVKPAIMNGCRWLAGLQNRDGGIPTFCKGWGRLPFDQSCADLTGHTLLAWIKTIVRYGAQLKDSEFKKLNRGISRALRFLEKEQRVDGSWLPLWFGNQMTSDKTNPVYGTARVAVYLQDAIGGMSHDNPIHGRIEPMLACAVSFLAGEQNEDGSWGAGRGVQGSMEETALALSALIVTSPDRCKDGFAWLDHEFQEKGLPAKPIGLYFASLWYSERMYPMVYYLEALRRAGKY